MPELVVERRWEPTSRKRAKSVKRFALNMRTTLEMRARLEEAAKVSGRSLVQEVSHRLATSFRLEDDLGSLELAQFMRRMAHAADLTEATTGKKWQEHSETYLAVTKAWDQLYEQFKARMRPPESAQAREIMGGLPTLPPRPDVLRPKPEELQEGAYVARP